MNRTKRLCWDASVGRLVRLNPQLGNSPYHFLASSFEGTGPNFLSHPGVLCTEMSTAFTFTSTTIHITASNVCTHCFYFKAPVKVAKMKECELKICPRNLEVNHAACATQAELIWHSLKFCCSYLGGKGKGDVRRWWSSLSRNLPHFLAFMYLRKIYSWFPVKSASTTRWGKQKERESRETNVEVMCWVLKTQRDLKPRSYGHMH